MKKIIFSLILSSILFVNAFSQTGSIRGRVFDNKTKEALPGANVYFIKNGKAIGVSTDTSGNYLLKDLNYGKYTIYFSYVGYNRDSISNIIINSDLTKNIGDYNLTTNQFDIIIDIIDPYYIFEDFTNVKIRSNELEKLPQKRNILEIINAITPGTYVYNDGTNISFRGSRNGGIVYYVDGIKTRNSNIGIPNTAIKRMSVYIGGVPAKYGDFDGAVVEIETKDF